MERHSQAWRWLVVGLVALVAAPAWGQKSSLIGRIIQDDAVVRAGAGDSYYAVGQLKRGAIVNIADRFFEWYKITPPPGMFSYVSKERVKLGGAGRTGIITKDRTPVKAASIDGPGKSYRRQMDLFKNDTVKIIDANGDFYRIEPPRLAYVFVLVSSVKREAFVPAPAVAAAPPVVTRPPAKPIVKQPVVVKATPPIKQPTKVTALPPALMEVPVKEITSAAVLPADTVKSVIDESAVASTASVQSGPMKTPGAAIETVGEPRIARQPLQPITSAGTPDVQPEPGVVAVTQEPMPTFRSPTAAVETPPAVTPMVAEAPMTPAVSVASTPSPEVISSGSLALTSMSLAQLNRTMEAVEKMPLEQQPIGDLLAAYDGHYQSESLTASARRDVLMRIIKLQRNAALARTLQEIALVQQGLDRMAGTPTLTLSSAPVLGLAAPVEYDAVGRLAASGVYDGINLPRLYRLVSPNMRTVAYLRPSDLVNTTAMLGKVVAVKGPARYDPALKLNVLEAQSIDLLRAQVVQE